MRFNLSYTANEKYSTCPRSYFLHYIRGLREEKTGSPLVFGKAMDEGINTLLLTKDLEKAETTFLKVWTFQSIHGKEEDLSIYDKIKYSKADEEDFFLKEDDQHLLNNGYIKQWVNLRRKGLIMLNAYNEQVLPKIKKVIAVQTSIELHNEENDKMKANLDLICLWNDGRILLVDNKTSSSKYKEDSVRTSKQLSTYFHAGLEEYKFNAAAYFVIPKNLRKKKLPMCEIDVIIDQVNDELMEKTFSEYNENIQKIKFGLYQPDFTKCDSGFYGSCPYKDLCQNGSLKGLITNE